MPKDGFTSITVSDDVKDLWSEAWEQNQKEFAKRGITSFAGFVNALMYGLVKSEKLQFEALEIAHKEGMKSFVAAS